MAPVAGAAHGVAVVIEVRAVGRPDFDQPHAALGHDLGNSEVPADLDQLAARDDRVASVGKRVQRQHERCCAVVDDQRILGTGELAEERRAVDVARPALARVQVQLEIRES